MNGQCFAYFLMLAFGGIVRAESLVPPSLMVEDATHFSLQWTAAPDVALQHFVGGDDGTWETLSETFGEGAWKQPLESHFQAFRLARFASADVTLFRLEDRVTAMAMHQLERAIDPLATPVGEPPPDRITDRERDIRFNLFGGEANSGWSSQPGLIRSYSSAQRNAFQAFPLHSTSNPRLDSLEAFQAALDEARRWQATPHRYVDMNAPVLIDGKRVYPILDPRLETEDHVEGLATERDGIDGAATPDALPMPVPWLYVLKDGTMGELNAEGHWEGAGVVSATNPIVARVAWWMDDETSKINVNTASEGVYWDQPRANTPLERQYARFQPYRGEIQRHPGHPAMTSLSALLFPGKRVDAEDPDRRLTDAEMESIFALTPRVKFEGTRRGDVLGDVIAFDSDPLYSTVDAWMEKAATLLPGAPWERYQGLVTAGNASPEVSVLGRPRMSIWPLHETESSVTRSSFDRRVAELCNINRELHALVRADPTSRHGEFYGRSSRHNVNMFQFLMGQIYERLPSYGQSLATKYGARLKKMDYAQEEDYDKDHYQILLSWFARLRASNLVDTGVAWPFVDYQLGSSYGAYDVTNISLIGRNLKSDDGSSQNASNWFKATLEPIGPGRALTITELALVAFVTGEITLRDWTAEGPTFSDAKGPSSEVLQRILRNEHPAYEAWKGKPFGPEDVGKIFKCVQIGFIPEAGSPAYGNGRQLPSGTVGLITSGQGYAGGLSEDSGLKMNGIPLSLWGDNDQSSVVGPSASLSANFLPELPNDRRALGGLDSRLFRFSPLAVRDSSEGYYGADLLSNGPGPFEGLLCQTPVVISNKEALELSQEAPIQLAFYDNPIPSTGNLVQVFHIRFAPPGETRSFRAPEMGDPVRFDWSERFANAAASSGAAPVPLTSDKDAVRGLTVTHGDSRHVASKRVVPSELMATLPQSDEEASSHSLAWDVTEGNGQLIEPGTVLPSARIGRGLVAGVDYAPEIEPAFAHDPADRDHYAPLLGDQYGFPIDPSITRDFDNGFALEPDGPYMNKPDDGLPASSDPDFLPYFSVERAMPRSGEIPDAAHQFPRRMAPSPVAFGSIPSAVQANAPWTCLLFRPNVSDPLDNPHLGERGRGLFFLENRLTLEGLKVPQMASIETDPSLPGDHLWLDLFWMPNAEPADINTPFATEGKVNMNYAMFPFPYIKRATALHAVLKAEKVMGIPTSAGRTYKTREAVNPDWRYNIDANETLKAFEAKFAANQNFLTESEICEMFLVPEGQKWDPEGRSMRAFWDDHRLTGDNTLERPYAGLYSRLTTRSNVYRLHLRLEAIEKGADSQMDGFDPQRDRVLAGRWGSMVVKRVFNAKDVPAYLSNNGVIVFSGQKRMERFYEYSLGQRIWHEF